MADRVKLMPQVAVRPRRIARAIWPGLLLASVLLEGGCQRDPSGISPAPSASTGAAAQSRAPAARADESPPDLAPQTTATNSAANDENVELPAPPKPPELRDEKERADATRILASYGFPAHHSLTPLCGWRNFNPGGTTWLVDLFTSPLPAPELKRDYVKRLGERGLKENTWSIPATDTVERQLLLLTPDDLKRYPRCAATPPTDAKTLLVARRAR